MKTVFLRALEAEDKASVLIGEGQHRSTRGTVTRYEVDPRSFAAIPGSPFAYWASDQVRKLFTRHPDMSANGSETKIGLGTLDDFRFLRLAWEPRMTSRWRPLAKGGSFSRWYSSIPLVLGWDRDGEELKLFVEGKVGSSSRKIQARDFYFRPGVTWPRRTNGLSFRALPANCLFGDKGPVAFARGDDVSTLLSLMAVMNTPPFGSLVSLQLARTELAQSYEVGIIQRTPVPDLSPTNQAALATLARRAWSLKRGLDTRTETSHAFVLPALLQVDGETLAARVAAWSEHVREVDAELAAIQAEIDDRCFELYGIDEEDRRVITEGFGGSSGGSEKSEADAEGHAAAEDEAEAEAVADTATLAAELMSWAVGVAFGRFDVSLATGSRAVPSVPEPFDSLPVCSPAILTGDDGLPLAGPPAGYPLAFPDDGILVDDPGHPRDLTAAVRTVFEAVFEAKADRVWQEAAVILDPRGHDLRSWLSSGFFEHHLRRHSKSRRKAPIIWQLGTGSGRYSVWCYAQRLTRDRLVAVQNDIVAPKLAHEERRLSSLVTQAGPAPSARDRAEIATQQAIVDELRVLLDEARRVAPLWNPDLDDGIVLVLAPLWRLIPGHRAWQKELNSRWEELLAGNYDWAHLAMHLAPERVVLRCTTDRSLAIAHGLEDIFWVEGKDGKWTRRSTPTRPIDDLVAERTSPAIKAALASLPQAPGPLAGVGRQTRKAGVTA